MKSFKNVAIARSVLMSLLRIRSASKYGWTDSAVPRIWSCWFCRALKTNSSNPSSLGSPRSGHCLRNTRFSACLQKKHFKSPFQKLIGHVSWEMRVADTRACRKTPGPDSSNETLSECEGCKPTRGGQNPHITLVSDDPACCPLPESRIRSVATGDPGDPPQETSGELPRQSFPDRQAGPGTTRN